MPDESPLFEEIVKKAKKSALSLLTFRDRSEKELRDKLLEKEYPQEAVDRAIAYAYSFHYLDDRRYAENYVRTRAKEKSVFEMREELKNRGVSGDLIDSAIESSPVTEAGAVKALFMKKYGKRDLTDPKVYEKALRYFAGKSFPYSAAKDGIAAAIEALSEDAEEVP